MLYFGLCAVSYILFVFIAENFNPISCPSAPLLRRRWRLGRHFSLVTLLVGVATLLLGQRYHVDYLVLLALFLIASIVLLIPFIVLYYRRGDWQESPSPHLAQSAVSMPDQTREQSMCPPLSTSHNLKPSSPPHRSEIIEGELGSKNNTGIDYQL